MTHFVQRYILGAFLVIALVGIAHFSIAAEKIGVVLLHGKGTPDVASSSIGDLRGALENAGYVTELPTLPWQRQRMYDATVEQAFQEIDTAVEKLRQRGAAKIVVAGHSMGGGIGMAYAAQRPDVTGLIVIAPGHVPDSPPWRKRFADDVARAKAMIASGKGGEFATFEDRNQGKNSSLSVRANVYLSYFDPDGLAAMRNSAARLNAGTRVLWIVEEDKKKNYSAQSIKAIPESVTKEYLELDTSHRDAPENSADAVIAWLEKLP